MRAMLVVGTVAIVLAGCSGGGDDADTGASDGARPFVEALASNLAEVGDGQLALAQEEAECVAQRWIDVFGLDRMSDAGVTPSSLLDDAALSVLQLSDDEGDSLFESFSACDVDLRHSFGNAMLAGTEASSEDVACLSAGLDDDLLERFFIVSLHEDQQGSAQDDQNFADLQSILSECGIA